MTNACSKINLLIRKTINLVSLWLTLNVISHLTFLIEKSFLQGVDTAVKAGEYGGNITTNILEVEVKPEHHASVFICEAINEELQESVHNARTLSVKCKLF